MSRADALYWEIVCVLSLPTLAICSSNYGDFEQMNLTTQPLWELFLFTYRVPLLKVSNRNTFFCYMYFVLQQPCSELALLNSICLQILMRVLKVVQNRFTSRFYCHWRIAEEFYSVTFSFFVKSGALELNFRGANPISEGIIEFDIVAPMHQLWSSLAP